MIEYRIGKVNRVMENEKLDALILTCFDNIRYATDFWLMNWVEGFYEGYAAIVKRGGGSYIYSSFEKPGEIIKSPLDDKPHIKEVIGIPGWYPLSAISGPLAETFGSKLQELGVKKVGFDNLPVGTYELLRRQLPSAEFKPVCWQLLETRAVKHEEEIRLIEANCSILDAAASEGLKAIREGKMTEHQIAARIISEMYELGIECFSHCGIVSPRPSHFLTYTNRKPLIEGDVVWFDIGFYGKGGYATDMARTCFVGRPAKWLLDAYKKFHEVYFKCLNTIKPGIKASEIDSLLRNHIRELGYGEHPHASGHGIGLRVCELPSINSSEHLIKDMDIVSGMVLNVEPMIEVSGVSLKIEDVILVTDTGNRFLNKAEYGI